MLSSRKKKWNKKIWIARKIGALETDTGREIPIYDKPKMYKMNVQPVSSEADIEEFGEYASQMQKTVIEYNKYFDVFKEFDIAWLDETSPLNDGGEFIVNVSDLDQERVKVANGLKVYNIATGKMICYAGKSANYRLHPPRNQNKVITIYFQKLAER